MLRVQCTDIIEVYCGPGVFKKTFTQEVRYTGARVAYLLLISLETVLLIIVAIVYRDLLTETFHGRKVAPSNPASPEYYDRLG